LIQTIGAAQARPGWSFADREFVRQRLILPPFDRVAAKRYLVRAASRSTTLQTGLRRSHVALRLLIDNSRTDDRAIAGQLVSDLDRIGVTLSLESVTPVQFEERLRRRTFDLALLALLPQVAQESSIIAGAFARVGAEPSARSCVRAPRCTVASTQMTFQRTVPFIPLLHYGARIHHDSRLSPLRLTPVGLFDLADVAWRRMP
jgi:MarR-like DNA-binding transcriptional regulator SgrR of sgrS sRNA